ncbi:MAG: peptidase domain protein [Phycisphaerales bacterium]|nr:peptidase domain protein [Phycisphaerales bacterium]
MAAADQSKRSLRSSHILPSTIEALETRRLFCALDDGVTNALDIAHSVAPDDDAHAEAVDQYDPTSKVISDALAKHDKPGKVVDHTASWYKPARKITIRTNETQSPTKKSIPISRAVSTAGKFAAAAVNVAVNAAGLPLLTSRADGQGLKIFLDFDGYNTDIPFDMSVAQGGDGNGATFNAVEQTVIYNAWRDIVSFYSAFNVNVTTIQPATGGSNPAFVWQRITDSVSGGAAYVGAINNSSSQGWTDDSNAISRTSGIAHEIGHQLNLQHQSDFNTKAVKLNEYSSGFTAHGPIIGVDYAQSTHKWFFGRNSISADTLQNDMVTMANYIIGKGSYGDGYMPDDFTGASIAAATPLSLTNGSYQTAGDIERNTDADYFSFTSTGSMFNVNVEPTFEAGIAPRFEIYNSSGTLIASKDDTSYRNLADNTGEEVNLNLPAGTYYARVSGHGDYGDQGEYAFFASPLPAGWSSGDISASGTGRGGYVTYDASTGTFYQGGSGSDIAGSSDAMSYTYQTLNGDGSITAQITGLDNTNSAAKAGLMLRESLGANARHAYVYFTPTGSQFSYRTTVGGGTSIFALSALMPGWLRLTRSGNVVTMFTSLDNVTYTAIGSATFSALANQVYLGMAVTSKNTKQQATATLANVSLTGTFGATAPTYNALPAPTGLSATPVATQSTSVNLNWSDGAGETGYLVERSADNVNWVSLFTTAANATTYTDPITFGSMRWWYRISAVDATGKSTPSVSASVINKPKAATNGQAVTISSSKLSLTWRDTSGDTGYRVEQSTDGGATYATLANLATNITGYNYSGLPAGAVYTIRVTPLSPVGDGVPLVFTGATNLPAITTLAFTANKLAGNVGMTWTDIAGETGYRVERSTDKSTWATIGTTSADVTTYTDTSALGLTHYYYRVFGINGASESMTGNVIFLATPSATPIPTPWIDADIGAPGGSGAGFVSGSTATVIGAGSASITGTADTQNFIYRPMTGDGEIIAHVGSLEGINGNSRAGLMFRESLASNAKYASVFFQSTTGTLGTDAAYRSTAGAAGVLVNGASTATTAYTYLRMVRSGSTFATYASTTGAAGSWVQINLVSIAMNSTLYVGLFAQSADSTYHTATTFDGLSVTPAAASIPTVSSFVVNDGAAQRSSVTSMKLTFSTPAVASAGAITLWRRPSAGATAVQISGVVLTPSAGNTVYTLTFPAGTFTGGSVADGLYEVRVVASGVTNADGFNMTADATFNTYRLYGDADGSHTVDFNDFLTLQNAFGTTVGQAGYVPGMDANGDNTIDFNDFLALQNNFGLTL